MMWGFGGAPRAGDRRHRGRLVPVCVAVLLIGGWGSTRSTSANEGYRWQLPPGFPEPVVPAANPISTAKVTLGRWLFFDKRLSGPGTLSCAGCHQPERAFTDGRARAQGATGERHPRSAMSLANVAYNLTYTWADSRVRTLERQVRTPLFNRHPVEMGLAGAEPVVLGRLRADEDVRRRFRAAFPVERVPVTVANIVKALASFERTLISGDAPFDRYVYRDDRTALSPAAQRGRDLFFDERLGCSGCHGGFTLSGPARFVGGAPVEPTFHNTGLYNLRDARGRWGRYPATDLGLYEQTHRRRDWGRFRAPTLRNIARTAPYMHDGSIATLDEVIAHYATGGRTIASGPFAGKGAANPYRSPRILGFEISVDQTRDLIAFLESLTDEGFLSDPRFQNPFSDQTPIQ